MSASCASASGLLGDYKTGNTRLRTELAQQFQSFRGQRTGEDGHAGDVTPWPVEACDESELDRVAADYEHNRDGRSRSLRGLCRGNAADREDHRYLLAHELGCQCR